jgi:hypothetical protein
MKMRLWWPILIVALLPAHPAWARGTPREIDCQAGDTLTRALQAARPGDEFIINGVCHEAVRQQNGDAGLLADNGSAVHVINSTITGNRPGRDIVLTFGARADLAQNPALGSITCDETVLIRGDTVTVCPTP